MVYAEAGISNLRILITQEKEGGKVQYQVSFSYDRGSLMSDRGEADSPEDAYRRAIFFVRTKPLRVRLFDSVTERNLEIFRMYVVEGLNYEEIQERAGIVPKNIARHIAVVRGALGAANTRHAAYLATVAGLIP